MAPAAGMVMSCSRRNAQQDIAGLTAGFSITRLHASFYIASSANAPGRGHAPVKRKSRSTTREMRAKPLEVMPTIAESLPIDVTYDDLSSTTRDLQERLRQQYQQSLEKRCDHASLRRLEAAMQTKKDSLAAVSAQSDQESLRILEAATRVKEVGSTHPPYCSSRLLEKSSHVATTGDAVSASSRPPANPFCSHRHSLRVLELNRRQIIEHTASTTDAAAQTTGLRMQALSTLASSVDSFVQVASSPSTPSSSLFRLPTRPTYHRALETDPGPGAAPTRPWMPQRVLTAFPEIGRFVGAEAPQPAARTFTRVDSGAYSSDNPPSSGRPLRSIGGSRSPSWSSEGDAGGVAKNHTLLAEQDAEHYHDNPPKTSRCSFWQSRISGWTSEEEALADTRNGFARVEGVAKGHSPCSSAGEAEAWVGEDRAHVNKDRQVYQETPSKASRHSSIRQPKIPSWPSIDEALEAAEDDFVHVEEDGDIHSETSPKPRIQESRSSSLSTREESAPSLQDDLISFEQDADQSSSDGTAERASSVQGDFDLIRKAPDTPSEAQRRGSLPPQLNDEDSTYPSAAEAQQWLEIQLADAMGTPPRTESSKIQKEYADMVSPTRSNGSGPRDESVSDGHDVEDVHFGEDQGVQGFEDWEDLGNKRIDAQIDVRAVVVPVVGKTRIFGPPTFGLLPGEGMHKADLRFTFRWIIVLAILNIFI
ncbi:hypothetical protein DOTSEDRAFT_18959 [Dothistroma septosporum NZE10]|uniref:Uncharacterized protein n=1 Tax=Dothistroma septosporum (strain NZE10 / CBS 128990) TaxID=675120 RepID=N1PY18_DOTSN|nr:hypothetical protein DOTSEDRAFT_18959 [Dothistroma septosporum NZE10]